MHSPLLRWASRKPLATAGAAALVVLLTAAAAWLWAHEGHDVLPTRGVSVDPGKGIVLLSPEACAALGIETGEVRRLALEDRIPGQVTLVAPWQRHAFATARLGGKVAAVHAQPGQAVKANQSLAEVQSLEMETLQADLLKAEADVRLAADNRKQVEAAARRGDVAEQAVFEARSQHQEGLNAREIARRKLLALGISEKQLERLTAGGPPLRTLPISSPITGVVIHADVPLGRVVEPSEHLFEILDVSQVWAKIEVLESDLRWIEPGQVVELRFAAYRGPDDVFRAPVQGKGRALDATTRLGVVWADLANPTGAPPRLLPGMFGQAEVIRAGKPATVVPAAALIRDGAERYVLVEEGPGQYARKNVVVGRQTPEWAEVRNSGVFPGDRVVTVGCHELASYFVQGVLRPSPEAQRTISLRVEPARRRVVAEVVQVTGEVELPPGRRAAVSARLPGTVRRILVGRDQPIQAGEVVAEVASLELQNLQLGLLRNQLDAELLGKSLSRLRSLAERGSAGLSRRQLRETENAHAAAVQQRDALHRKLEAAGLSPEQLRGLLEKRWLVEALPVRAPVGGTVVRLRAALGQWVKAEEPLFEVHDLAGALVRGHVSERQLPLVRLGQPARVRLPADPGRVVSGKVIRSGQEFQTAERTLFVWVEPGDGWRESPQGSVADVALVVAEPPPTLAVPNEALWQEGRHHYLFVRQPDGTFERRRVEPGRADDRFTEITHGLREGEEVAVQGVGELQTGYAAVR